MTRDMDIKDFAKAVNDAVPFDRDATKQPYSYAPLSGFFCGPKGVMLDSEIVDLLNSLTADNARLREAMQKVRRILQSDGRFTEDIDHALAFIARFQA